MTGLEIGLAVLGSNLITALVGNYTTRRSRKADTDAKIMQRIDGLVTDVSRMEVKLDGAIDHIDDLKVYIYDNVPNADPPKTPAFLRK